MKLEDFFNQTAPTNYVEFPPKKSPSLETFFAERTPVVSSKPESTTIPTPKAVSPVTPNRVEQIKSIFSPQQQIPTSSSMEPVSYSGTQESMTKSSSREPVIPQPSEQQISPVTPSYDWMNTAEIRDYVDKAVPKASLGETLANLTPLAVEALFGGGEAGGVSYGISSDALLKDLASRQEKKKTLESKLSEIQKLRTDAMLKEPKTLEVVGPEGKPIITPIKQAIGKEAWKSPAKSGLTFAERAELEKVKFGLKSKLDQGKATKEEQKRLQDIEMKLAEKWEADPFTRDTKTVAASYNALSKVDPYSPDPVKDIAVIFDFMKTLDPRSVVRESEQTLVMGARSIQDIVNNLIEVKSGQRKLTPDQILGIQRFAANNYQRRLDSQKAVVDEQFRKRAEKYGVNPDMIVGDLSVGTPVLWQNSKTKKWTIVPLSNDDADFAIKNLGAKKVE
jgi:hypothetical protein